MPEIPRKPFLNATRNKWLTVIALFLVLDALLCFWLLGRSIWGPVYTKLSGGRTITEAVADIEMNHPKLPLQDLSIYEGLTLIGLKQERLLEVWGHRTNLPPEFITAYPFTGYSGQLGPKLREGDRQIPEGLYQIEYLNPNSSFHLSMKIDYPNAFDREKGQKDGREKLGFDIFIHGKSSTIGCIPIGDPAIEALFAMVARIGPDHVDVILAPYDMRSQYQTIEISEIDWEAELYQKIQTALATHNR